MTGGFALKRVGIVGLGGFELSMRILRTRSVSDGAFQNPIDEAVLDRFLGTHETVTVHVLLNLLQRLTRMLS